MNTQLVIIFNSEKSKDERAVSYLQAIPGISVTMVDIASHPINENELTALAAKMDLGIEDLLDPAYDDHICVHTEGLKLMDRQSLLTLMTQDTKLIITPIAIMGDHAFLLENGQDGVEGSLAFELASRVFSGGMGNVDTPLR